eukprot:CAMPEP_0204169600 /NCGR_PEP_ID=MMETSP0361-20130328/41673_1 /ASSEMBLY_ACC=CAM_ASM_000343 /TAXON_ID=268821 /ORGANISM="Scrippsiella Hangoei, Strain SHTV-5" /LENGTH=496 /DNA_ID=CAMNT_0051127199 /DNA_START=152 /DNA_END=1643 /DNA_ORIENTATION=-
MLSAAPPSPRESVVRFAELTGVSAATAIACLDRADEYSVPLGDAIAKFLETGEVVSSEDRAAAKRHAFASPGGGGSSASASAAATSAAAKRPRLDFGSGGVASSSSSSASAAAAALFAPARSPPRAAAAAGVTAAGASAGDGGAAGVPGMGRIIPEAEARAAKGIPDGCETHFAGGSGPYKITRRGDIYTCACPAWRNQKLGPFRTCKHIKELAAAAAAKGKNKDIEKGVMLAHNWDEGKVNPKGYLMSEKLDGMRAIWHDGSLWSRAGNIIVAPAFFLAELPKGFKLDGELFLGRGRFSDVMSVCRCHCPNEAAWRNVRYIVFDAPAAKGGLTERLAAARAALGECAGAVVRVHPQVVCEGVEHVYKELDRILALDPPAEGLMLAASNKPHRGGRCNDILKVKKFHTQDAKVVGHKPGKGKHVGRLGALECRLRSGQRFDVGSGFSDADRDAYQANYPIGTIVEFRYFEITDAGVPRFPTFVRIRPDVDPSEFPA